MATSNPFLGVLFHWLGGLGAASFYVFYRQVKNWSWEVYWLTGGLFMWIVMPWIAVLLITHDPIGVLSRTPGHALLLCYLFGALWGIGSLTWALAMRYLGLSLGQGLPLGLCVAGGALLPPFFKGQLPAIAASRSGKFILAGVGVTLLGVAVSSLAGWYKEREMSDAEKKKTVKEFNFWKGAAVALFSGIMSSFMAFGLDAGTTITRLSVAAGTPELYAGLPKMIVILAGGFSSNLVYCLLVTVRKKTARQFVEAFLSREARSQLLANYLFCALAGTTWYLQYFFYTMGESQMGRYQFSSFSLHLTCILIFSTMWGWVFKEWKGSSRHIHVLVAAGVAILVLATLVTGYGNYLDVAPAR